MSTSAVTSRTVRPFSIRCGATPSFAGRCMVTMASGPCGPPTWRSSAPVGEAPDVAEGARARYFPHVRWEPEVIAVHDHVERVVGTRDGEEWAGAQLLLRSTDHAASWPVVPHVDEVPSWGGGRGDQVIVGVALNRPRARTAACRSCRVARWPGRRSSRGGVGPGDVVLTGPQLAHCASLTRCDRVRCAHYLRLLRSCPAAGE